MFSLVLNSELTSICTLMAFCCHLLCIASEEIILVFIPSNVMSFFSSPLLRFFLWVYPASGCSASLNCAFIVLIKFGKMWPLFLHIVFLFSPLFCDSNCMYIKLLDIVAQSHWCSVHFFPGRFFLFSVPHFRSFALPCLQVYCSVLLENALSVHVIQWTFYFRYVL